MPTPQDLAAEAKRLRRDFAKACVAASFSINNHTLDALTAAENALDAAIDRIAAAAAPSPVEQDAARYRWLRDTDSDLRESTLEDLLGRTDWDAAIDAARAVEQPAHHAQAESADMFWDNADGERFGHDIDEIVAEYDLGSVVKIDRAKRLSSITVRVVKGDDDEFTYEVVPVEQPKGGA